MYHKVSVLVPTRKRVASLQRMIASYELNTPPSQAEMIFRIDEDDLETQMFLLNNGAYETIVGPRGEGYKSIPQYFAEMLARASGTLILCGNDDMEFQTPRWTEHVFALAERYPDGLFAIGVETFNAQNFPFTIVSKKMVDRMGSLYDDRLLFHDVYLRDVAASFGRALRLPSVTIAHHWAGFAPDEVRKEAAGVQGETVYAPDGGWKDSYTRLHVQAVRERVKILLGEQA